DLVMGNQGLGVKLGLGSGEYASMDWLMIAPQQGWQGERKLVQLDGNALADWMAFGEGSLFQAAYNVDGTQGEVVDLNFDVLPAFGEHLLVQFEFIDVLGGASKELLLFSSPDAVDMDLWIYNQTAPATFELIEHQAGVIPGINQYLNGISNRFEVKGVDVDNDGDLDLSIYQRGATSSSFGNIFVLNNTDGVFTPHQTLSNFGFSNYSGGPQWIDLTGDGLPEIASSSINNMGLMIHPNTDGMITPTNAPSASLVSTVYPVSLNNDNLMDLIVHSYNTPVRKWINLGNLEFDVIDIGTSVPSLNGVVDINNDGELDILTNGLTYMGQGDGEFQSVSIDMVPASFLSFAQAIPIYGDYNFLPDLFYGDLYEFSYYPNISQDLTPPLGECPSDFNEDGITNVADLVEFIQAVPCYGVCLSDLNQDFITDVTDLQLFLEAYGVSCE
ncbi:MAG: VCBS repeat-containing protein, partial [Bacteroidetes bacterium]|nr:VCBS repeat-containing protein [Bacteroidota bacterium]